MASYLLQVKSMLGPGQGPSLVIRSECTRQIVTLSEKFYIWLFDLLLYDSVFFLLFNNMNACCLQYIWYKKIKKMY